MGAMLSNLGPECARWPSTIGEFDDLGPGSKAVIVMNRQMDFEPWRNFNPKLMEQLADNVFIPAGVTHVIIVGDPVANGLPKHDITWIDMTNFHASEGFKTNCGQSIFAGQLNFYKYLHDSKGVLVLSGMMSGALDGPAFIGVPVAFFRANDFYETR